MSTGRCAGCQAEVDYANDLEEARWDKAGEDQWWDSPGGRVSGRATRSDNESVELQIHQLSHLCRQAEVAAVLRTVNHFELVIRAVKLVERDVNARFAPDDTRPPREKLAAILRRRAAHLGITSPEDAYPELRGAANRMFERRNMIVHDVEVNELVDPVAFRCDFICVMGAMSF